MVSSRFSRFFSSLEQEEELSISSMVPSKSTSKKRSFSEHSSSSFSFCSSPKTSDSAGTDGQSLKAEVKKLLGRDLYPLIKFLENLFVKDANSSRRSEAEAKYEYAKKHYPNALVSRTCELCSSTPFAESRHRCMNLLHRLLLQDGIWDAKNLSIFTRNDIKKWVFDRLKEEDDFLALNTLISLVSEIGAKEFRQQRWGLLLENMLESFQSLNLASDPEKHVISCLFKEMIPKFPEIFSPEIVVLSKAFADLMGSDSYMLSVPAVGAALNLVSYLVPSEKYQDYSYYLNLAENVLHMSINDNEHEYAQTILEDFLSLAENKIDFVRLNIDLLIDRMVVIAGMPQAQLKNRQLAIEFVIKLAENREWGCGMIQKMPDKVRSLLAVLVQMLEPIEVELSLNDWVENENDDQQVVVPAAYDFAKSSLIKIANAVRGKVIGTKFLESLNQGMYDTDWRIRHKSVVALGLVSKGYSKIMLRNLQPFVDKVQNLIKDVYNQVRWAAIHTFAQFCKDFSPYLQEQFHSLLVPAITGTMDDFYNPTIQADGGLALQLFSQNSRPGILKPYLERIISKLLIFLQMEKPMLKEVALTALASIAASSKEDFLEYYGAVMSHLKAILITAKCNGDCSLIAKTVNCITKVGLAVGKEKFHIDSEKVIEQLIALPESERDMDGPVRSRLLQAWGRLCKSLGTKFLPFLNIVMPKLIRSLYSTSNLTVTAKPDYIEDLDDDRVIINSSKIGLQHDELSEKALACNVFCWLAAELKGGLHLWISEVENAVVPLINFKLNEEVRTAAMSSVPLLLQSALCATKEGLSLDGFNEYPIESLIGSIITALLDALRKDPKAETCAKILEALNSCMQVAGGHLKKDQVKKFPDVMDDFLTTFAYRKTERENRVNQGLDLREKDLLDEQNKQEEEVYKKIVDCLGTFINTYKTSMPLCDEIWPFIERLWVADKTAEERNIGVHIFHAFAKEYKDDAHRYWDCCLPFLLEACSLENPEVLKAVARGIAICAEFGQIDFKRYVEVTIDKLSAVVKDPEALLPRNVTAHEASVYALGRICLFHIDEIKNPWVFSLWLSYLPIKTNSEEAKIVHDQLCLMLAGSEKDSIIGPKDCNIPMIIEIFAEVLWAGNHLATDKTINWIKDQLKLFRKQTSRGNWEFMVSPLPHWQQKMIERILK